MSDRAAKVNFYQQWLGIECRSRPDHYQLLGVARFESDEQRILAGFDQRRRQLREISPGQYEPEWRKLADELIAAKRCLLTPAARLAYDEHLRFRDNQKASKPAIADDVGLAGKLPGFIAPSAVASVPSAPKAESRSAAHDDLPELPPTADGLAPSAESSPPFLAPSDDSAPLSAQPVAAHSIEVATNRSQASGPRPASSSAAMAKLRRDGQRARRNLAIWSVLLVAVVGGGLAVISQFNPGPTPQISKSADAAPKPEPSLDSGDADPADDRMQAPPAVTPDHSEPPPEPPQPPETKPGDGADSMAEMPMPESMSSAERMPSAEPMPSDTPDAEQAEQFRAALRSIRTSLADRDVDLAEAQLDVASALARGDEQDGQLGLYRQLVADVAEFWLAVGEAAKKMNGGEELERNGRPFAVVVESSSSKLVIRADGSNRTLAIPGDLTAELAELLARRALAGQPQENRLLGAFYAVDRRGDLAQAEKYWQSEGQNTAALLELLRWQSPAGE